MKKVLSTLAVVLALLAIALVVRTVRLSSRQPDAESAPAIPVDAEAAARRLAEALRYRTVSSQARESFAASEFDGLNAYLQRAYPRMHGSLVREVVGDHSLVYRWQSSGGAARPPILLLAHSDVVPVDTGTESEWEQPPFGGVIAGGYVWGRGAMDDKSNLVAMCEAIELLLGEGFVPTREIYFAFGHDEEVGGQRGAEEIARRFEANGVRFEYALDEGGSIAEGLVPGVAAPVAMVGIAEKGYVSVELSVDGRGGHSSMPPLHTAVGLLSRAIARLEEAQMPANVGVGLGQTFAYLGPEMSFPNRLVTANLWLFGGLVERRLSSEPSTNAAIRTTTAATMFAAGVKENVLPSDGRAVVNFRILPGDDIDAVLQHVEETVSDPEVKLKVLEFASDPSPVSSTASASFDRLARTIRQQFPDAIVSPGLVLGATDSRHYAAVADDVYRFTPMRMSREDLGRIHGLNERVGIDAYAEMARFYIRLIRNSES